MHTKQSMGLMRRRWPQPHRALHSTYCSCGPLRGAKDSTVHNGDATRASTASMQQQKPSVLMCSGSCSGVMTLEQELNLHGHDAVDAIWPVNRQVPVSGGSSTGAAMAWVDIQS